MPLYRRLEPDAQLLEYRCIEFVEEFLYGHVRKRAIGHTLGGGDHDRGYHTKGPTG